MKKTLRLFSMAALALTMAACSNDDNVQENAQPAAGGKMHFTATIAAPNSGAETRTTYTEVTEGTDAGKINVAWKVGDEIALVHNDVVDKATVKTVNSDGSATIEGGITGNPSDGNAVNLVYPYAAVKDATASGSLPFTFDDNFLGKLNAQDGTLEFIQDNIDLRKGSGTLAVSDTGASLKESVNVSSIISIWKFTLQDESSTALNATKVTVKYGSVAQVAATSTTAKSAYYLGIVPSFLPPSGDLNIEATTASGDYIYTKTGGAALDDGKYYQSTVTMAKPTDLSMVDCAGNARAAGKMWTANCYMVHTAGYYKLPLVYGNAIKDGATNAAAYTGVDNTNTTLTFPNHAGTAISAPWITKSATGEGVNKGMGIAVSSAELLWQDAEGLITAVGIDGDYLTLTVGKDATAQEGNAVIAAKKSDGTIVWSWHIWVTKQKFATEDLTTIATGSHTYSVTPVNLGWVGAPVSKGYNTYYQWGRKDAFIPSDGETFEDPGVNHTVYNISGTAVTGFTYSATSVSIADNIKNPTTFNYNSSTGGSSTGGPCNTTYYNMWDAQNTAVGNVTSATKKTVYDPCPPGFCVPTGNLYYYAVNGSGQGASSAPWDGTNKGRTWQDIFFPASGYRNGSSGALYDVGSSGSCWSASPSSIYSGHCLRFSWSSWDWSYTGRAAGFSVRAVAEE